MYERVLPFTDMFMYIMHILSYLSLTIGALGGTSGVCGVGGSGVAASQALAPLSAVSVPTDSLSGCSIIQMARLLTFCGVTSRKREPVVSSDFLMCFRLKPISSRCVAMGGGGGDGERVRIGGGTVGKHRGQLRVTTHI